MLVELIMGTEPLLEFSMTIPDFFLNTLQRTGQLLFSLKKDYLEM